MSYTPAPTVLDDVLKRVETEKDRVIMVTSEGREVAALVPIEDLLELEEIEASRREAKEKGAIPLNEVKARLGL